ncbi:MAG: hypothetical protein RBR16_13485 [Syntrophus sp. (in: bacteria)]|nr:hypothetical protein [Syntrophus sp. (in: bacteria)]
MDFFAAVKQKQPETAAAAQGQAPPVPAKFKAPPLPAIEGLKGYLSQTYGARYARVVQDFEALRKTGVDSEEQSKQAVAIASQAKKLAAEMERERKEFTGPINTFLSKVKAAYDHFTGALTGAEKEIKRLLVGYQARVELERRKAEEAARKEAEELQKKLDAEAKEAGVEAPIVTPAVVAPKPTVTRTEEGTAYEVVTWEFEIEDEAKIPRDYLMADLGKIRQAVKAGIREIPGVKIFEKKEMRVRT